MGKNGLDMATSTPSNDNRTLKGPKNRFKGRGDGPKWKKLKQETGKLKLGTRGLLITNSIGGKYKEAMQEVLYILRQHAEAENDNKDEDSITKSVKQGVLDPEQMLQQELNQVNQEFDRFVPGSCISKGLNFVVFKNEADVPSKYVQEIFTKILENKAYSARFLSKIVPIDHICSANEDDLKKLLESMFKSEFPLSAVGEDSTDSSVCTTDSGSTNNDGCGSDADKNNSGNRPNNGPEEPLSPGSDTWALYYKNTNSNALNRDSVLNLVTQLLRGKYKVNLKVPDKLIVVCVVKVSPHLAVESSYSHPNLSIFCV